MSKIRPEDLRIGNLVEELKYTPDKWENKLVRADTFGKIKRHPEYFRGIPLSREWLDKVGFVKSGGYIIHLQEKLWLSVELPINGSSRTTSDISITWDYAGRWITGNLNYVHQLQNLYFALTGIELLISLD